MNDAYQKLLHAKEVMLTSPLRIYEEKNKPVKTENPFFNEDTEALNILIRNVLTSLTVGILGEVKAGKSTLINALAGKDVSPSDALEATASIIEVKFSTDSFAKLHHQDGTVKEYTIEKAFELLNEHQNDQEFFSLIHRLEFGMPLQNLSNLTLVDTPGLETVTKENEEKTMSFIQNADVFLWVINAHYLGQSDIQNTMMEIIKSGKPVIALLNRVDEVDGDIDRLVEYLDDEIGMYVHRIFPISAYQAKEAVFTNNKELKKESGYSDLILYLEEQINQKVDEVKVKSTLQACNSLLHRDLVKHEEVLNTANFVEKQLSKVDVMVKEYSNKTLQSVNHAFQNWYSYEFLEKEKKNLHTIVKSGSRFNNKQMLEELNTNIQKQLSNENIDFILSGQMNELAELFKFEWDKALKKLKDEILIDIENFSQNAQDRFNLQLLNSNEKIYGEGGILAGAATGAWIGGAAAASAAFYAAALGPAASYVTIGMAASAFMPPFLIIGASVGIAHKLLKTKKEKREAENNISELITLYKLENKRAISSFVSNLFEERAETVAKSVQLELTRTFCNQQTYEDLMIYKRNVEDYMRKVKKIQDDLIIHTVTI